MLLLASFPAAADVVLDGSFGSEGLVPAGTDPDGQFTNYLIEEKYGRLAGSNLFHSFLEFSIPGGESATFTAVNPIENVLARVTGGDVSRIDGALRSVIDGADLFLLNPSGVIFGPDASLEVQGSFHVSTADSLVFPDLVWPTGQAGGAVLTSAPPSAFGFLAAEPGSIELNGAQLSVPDGSTFSVVGGDISIVGRSASNVPSLKALAGQVQLASVASDLEVPVQVADLDVDSIASDRLGRVMLRQNAIVDVSGNGTRGSGSVVIRGGRFLMDDSKINALTTDGGGHATAVSVAAADRIAVRNGAIIQSSTSGTSQGGAIDLSGGVVVLRDRNTIVGAVTKSSAAGGDIRVNAGDLIVTDEANLITRSDQGASGVGGQIRLDAEHVTASDSGQIASETKGAGTGGGIEVRAQALSVTDRSRINSLSQGNGEGGVIHVDVAAGQVVVTDGGQITSEAQGSGAGGKVEVTADDLSVENAGQITTRAAKTATGRGGELEIHAGRILVASGDDLPEKVAQIGALSLSESGTPDAGGGGDLTITADAIELRYGGQIRTTTEGTGHAGDLEIHATDTLRASGTTVVMEDGEERKTPSGIFTRSAPEASGNGGKLFIGAKTVEIANGAEVSARTFGSGNAGKLTVEADERVSLTGGVDGPSLISARGFIGEGRNLAITTDLLELADGGQVSASTLGSGNSGNVTIGAREVHISGADPLAGNPSGVFARTNATVIDVPEGGNAGNIEMTASQSVRIVDGGQISVESRGAGNSGDITIDAGDMVVISDGGEVSARAAATGTAGSITVQGGQILTLSNGATITAQSAASGPAGSIHIRDVGEVTLDGASEISAKAQGIGDAGSINIETDQQLVLQDSAITTEAEQAFGGNIEIQTGWLAYLHGGKITTSVRSGEGDGGNIDIDPRFVVLNHSEVKAQADVGNGGNITIAAGDFLRSADSVVDASSRLGISGSVQILSPETDLSGDVAVLPTSFLDASSLLTDACAARSARAGSLVVRGQDRIPDSPDAPLRGFYMGGLEP
jgi:filamentous hemagglutinin family protein